MKIGEQPPFTFLNKAFHSRLKTVILIWINSCERC